MALDLYGLNKDDVNWLKWARRRLEGLLQNNPSALLSEVLADSHDQAPETYIALVPEEGIPACEPAVGTGGPAFQAGDIPGYADCGIYRITNGALAYTRAIKRVYNLTGSDITERWITVVRDKFGIWLAQTGGSSSCDPRNEVWMIAMTSGVEGGTFEVTFTVNEVQETLTIPAEGTATEIKTAFATHSELAESDLNAEGGDLPTTSVRLEFTGDQANTPIRLTSFSGENLNNIPGTGTGTPATESGLMVLIFRWQPGYAGS